MADINKERFYFVDPGIGEKGDFCPYSAFEDGHDVKGYIIPPKGYELSGFKLEPYDSPDHFYEGKIVAQFVKEEDIMEFDGFHFWKYFIAFVAVIGIIVGMIIFFINRNNEQEVLSEFPAEVLSTVDDSIKAIPPEKAVAQEITAEPEAVVEQDATKDEPVMEEIIEEEVVEEEIVKEEVVEEEVVKEETVKEEVVKEEKVESPTKEVVETDETPLPVSETTLQFKEEFWTLIHQQENKMPAYGKLFRTYKEQVEGEEYRYLGWTILRSNKDFEAWSKILLKVPSDKISAVNNIDQLTKLLEEYNN